jgi:two-component system, LytTR family, response regulator
MLKVYILDDEQDAIDGLAAMLRKKFAEQVIIAGSNNNAIQALDEIENMKIDLLFLDVEMPIMNGTEVLRYFPTRNFDVIFTTAHEKYAISAIKLDATDYLLKPISPMDMREALSRTIIKRQAFNKDVDPKITLSSHGLTYLIKVSDIIRIEADSNYSTFHFVNRPNILMSKTLKEYESMLPHHQFYRIHQSHLINIDYVTGISSLDGDFVCLSNGDNVELSRRRKPEFLLMLKAKQTK